ncbi:MAG: diguanylate cyclase [Pirellulales bacterium]
MSDWELPDGTGIDLIRWARDLKTPHYMYVKMLTGHSGHESIAEALNSGADEFVSKPIEKEELLARLRSGQRVLDLESRLSRLANKDPLTDLNTRRIFNEFAQKEYRRSRRYISPLSCVMFDIDFFKKINDTYGHPTGDAFIKEVAATLKRMARDSDITCRYGGEEFCVFLTDANHEQAVVWAERLRVAISEIQVNADGKKISITSSFGVAQMLSEMEDETDLIDLADQCLLRAKNNGRNCVVDFNQLRDSFASSDGGGEHTKHFLSAVASDSMTSIFGPLTSNSNIEDIAEFFLQFRISSAPVVDNKGQLVGIVSEKDLMSNVIKRDAHLLPIHDIMRTNVITYEANTPLIEIWEFLNRVSIRSVIIVEDNIPVGFIGRNSILRWFSNTVWRKSRKTEELSDSIQKNLQHTVSSIAEEAEKHKEELLLEGHEISLGTYIGRTSRMQELTNDLLSASSQINRSSEATGLSSINR